MPYTRVTWVDSPSTSTPISAANLNVMDAGIATLDGNVTTLLAKVTVRDTNTGSVVVKQVQLFIGSTDPTTIGGVTVNDGDVWLKA